MAGKPKAFPSDRRERFRGRWAAAGGSEEVGLPAISLVYVLFPGERPLPSFPEQCKHFPGNPPSPEPAASLPGEGFWLLQHLAKSEFVTLD